ncbi:hypothetical protein [uncultured Polaribacter sp.]|uniref:hypothetical protein n=1 Tax=uncultured Polaribacter sp. TaxID=174711 RepID=UPI002637368A|nr:hypothetical protein [uncultured Polaribacter sp.]
MHFIQKKENKFSIDVSYGLSLINYNYNFDNFIDLEIHQVGSFINLNYKIAF